MDSSSPFDPIAQIDHQINNQLQRLKQTAHSTLQKGHASMTAYASSKHP